MARGCSHATHITAPEPLPVGAHQVRVEFGYDGGGLGKAPPSRSSSTATK
ncbi:MAG: hypothetical protein ABWY04_08810 [Arthrobacter sp.]